MLAVFLGILLLSIIFLPLVIQLLQTESVQSVNHRKSTVAFQLAEAAVAKGVSKLIESRMNWNNAITGTPLNGYKNDVEYNDLSGGKYKINLASGITPGTVLIIGKGMDDSSRETRVIEATYSGIDPDAPALLFNQGQALGGANYYSVHWGSIKSWGNLNYLKDFSYPRIISSGYISVRDSDPTPPNTDSVVYWAYRSTMGSPPTPDLAYYKQKAMNSIVPSSSTTGEIRHPNGSSVARNPPNSGYFSSAWALQAGEDMILDKFSFLPEGMGNLYEFRSSTSVLYFDIIQVNSSFPFLLRTFLDVEAVIINGSEGGIVNSTVPYMVYGATIPESAPYQYQGNRTWKVGTPTGQTVWSSTFSAVYAQANRCCYNITNLQIHGYVYLSDPVTSRATFLGVAQQNTTNASWSTDSRVYYDSNVLNNIVWTTNSIYRISWKESGDPW